MQYDYLEFASWGDFFYHFINYEFFSRLYLLNAHQLLLQLFECLCYSVNLLLATKMVVSWEKEKKLAFFPKFWEALRHSQVCITNLVCSFFFNLRNCHLRRQAKSFYYYYYNYFYFELVFMIHSIFRNKIMSNETLLVSSKLQKRYKIR